MHVLADALGSVGVIISSILIMLFDWKIADPICSLVVSLLIAISVVPLLQSSVGVLLQKAPSQFAGAGYDSCVQQITSIAGVQSVSEPHFWANTSSSLVGSISVHVDANTKESKVLKAASKIFKAAGVADMTIQVVKV